jgi:serine/threonine-protein kinase
VPRSIPKDSPAPASTETLRPAPSHDAVLRPIQEDIRALKPADRPFQRYFSTDHLRAWGASTVTLDLYHTALTEAVNLVSARSARVVPTRIDPEKTIFRVDIRDLGWDERPFEIVRENQPVGPSSINRFDLVLLE